MITQEDPITCIKKINVVLSRDEKKEILDGNHHTWDVLNWSDHRAISVDIDREESNSQNTMKEQVFIPKLNWDQKKHKLAYSRAIEDTVNEMGLVNALENMIEASTENGKSEQLTQIGSLIEKCVTLSELKAINELGLNKKRNGIRKASHGSTHLSDNSWKKGKEPGFCLKSPAMTPLDRYLPKLEAISAKRRKKQ
jgi:hypothetical protein